MNRFEQMRFEKGYTLRDVQRGSGVSYPTLARLESEEDYRPSAPTAKALADFYEVTVADLLGLAERNPA